jgi:CubicO group peptidase (beta-lactamase class C family)/D-alanyl-D-alanine dipeptidase
MTREFAEAANRWQRPRLLLTRVLFVYLTVAIGPAPRAIRAQAVDDRYTAVVQQLEPWIAAQVRAKQLPALSIVLVDDQRIIWGRGFGFADKERRIAATADTVYRVGSVSKLFTDLAVMQLVEQGRLDLDKPVAAILPEFAPRNPFKTAITLRQLMSHRSGLVREPPVGHYFDPAAPPLIDVVKSLAGTTLVFEPGTRTKYSNAGVAVVGAVLERVVGKSFPEAIEHSLFIPLEMKESSFEPGPSLIRKMATGLMWTQDGQTVATPMFLLGTGPAGNLVSSAVDLSRFLSFIFAGGRGPRGVVIGADRLRSMIEPRAGRAGEPEPFGLGFAISKLDDERMIGHNGAVYGFASDVKALPDARLGAVVITSVDCANGIVDQIATTALRQMLAATRGRPLPALETSTPIAPERARQLAGHYIHDGDAIDIVNRNGKLLIGPLGGTTLEIRTVGNALVLDDRLASGQRISADEKGITLGRARFERTSVPKPAPCPSRWAGLIGEYGWDYDVLYIHEQDGKLFARIEWFFDYPLKEVGPDRFLFPDAGLYAGESVAFTRDAELSGTQVDAASVVFKRRRLDGEGGKTFQIVPRRSVDELRAEVRNAQPPHELGTFRKPELVELSALDPTIKLDIRYATTNNFMGIPLYTSARAFMQRPAAEAVLRVHRALAKQGYGLLIHDAYRPWQVTKLFWEATPDSGRDFVADPAKGSKHNRGCAVDLTLYDRATGKPVKMVGGYDEFSPRSFPEYPGGTSLEHWHRELLRAAMEAEGFTVNQYEWWHFDFRDWKAYPIINQRFEDLTGLGRPK